jgi:hypothetical protein
MAEDREIIYFQEGQLDFPQILSGKPPRSPLLIKGFFLVPNEFVFPFLILG